MPNSEMQRRRASRFFAEQGLPDGGGSLGGKRSVKWDYVGEGAQLLRSQRIPR